MKNRKKVLLTILSLILITLFTIPVGALSENDTSYSKYACGLNPTVEEDLSKFDEYIIDNTRYAVPTSVDLSQSNAFPPIGNQGNIGSCGSWATAYYQFGYQVANMYNWDAKHDLSKCFSPKFAYNIAKNDSGSSSFLENYTVLKNCGAVRYSEFTPSSTYSESEVNQWCIDTDKLTNALRNRVSISGYNEIFNPQIPLSYALITSPYSEYLNMMKHLLYTDHIITIGTVFGSSDEITIGGTTFTGNTNWQFDLANNGDIVCTQCVAPSNAQENHALAVVGYDDDISEVFSQFKVRPFVTPTYVDDPAIISMVEHNLGISMLSALTIADRHDNVRIVPISPFISRNICISVKPDKVLSLPLKRLISITKEAARTYVHKI